MIIRCVILFFLVSIMPMYAQHFEWASSGSNLLTGYSSSCVTSDGRLIAAGQYEQPSYQIMSDEPEIFSGSGKGFPIERYSDQFFVTCYNAQGEIDWLLKSGKWCDHGRLLGVTSLADGTVVVAFRTSYMQQYVTVIQDDGTTQSVGFDRSGNSG